MVLKKKNNFVKGYLQIEIEGFYIERFFNACTKQGIELWGTRRKNNTSIITNIQKKLIKLLVFFFTLITAFRIIISYYK